MAPGHPSPGREYTRRGHQTNTLDEFISWRLGMVAEEQGGGPRRQGTDGVSLKVDLPRFVQNPGKPQRASENFRKRIVTVFLGFSAFF